MAKAKRKPARYAQQVNPAMVQMAERLRAVTVERVPVLERALFGALAEQLSNPLLPMLGAMDQGMRLFAAFELALHAATTDAVEVEDACAGDEEVARYRAALVQALHALGARRDGPERLVTRLAGIGARQLELPSKGSGDLVVRVWAWFLLGVAAGAERHAEPEDWTMRAILTAGRHWAEQMAAAVASVAAVGGESEGPDEGAEDAATVTNEGAESADKPEARDAGGPNEGEDGGDPV